MECIFDLGLLYFVWVVFLILESYILIILRGIIKYNVDIEGGDF